MNLEEIRNLPDGPVPHTFYVQLKEMKFPPKDGKPAKVKLTDNSVGQVSAVIWRPAVPLQQFSWYEVVPGQDNQRREKVHIQTKEWNGKQFRELSIDGTAFLGPVQEPPGAPNAPAPAQGTSQGQRVAQNAPGAVQRQDSSALPLAEYQRWWLGRWEWYENSPAIQRAIARGEAVARTIRDAIGAEWMSQPPSERNIERSPYGGAPAAPAGPPDPDPNNGAETEDWDVPFALFLAPLLGALLSGVV